MQRKQNATRIAHSYSNKTRYTRDYFFLWWKDFQQDFSVFEYPISWNCIQYIFISRGAVFLMRKEYMKHDSYNSLKLFF